jgi:hypothetical protein
MWRILEATTMSAEVDAGSSFQGGFRGNYYPKHPLGILGFRKINITRNRLSTANSPLKF